MTKDWEQLIDEGYEKCDQLEYNMRELGLNNYGDDTYYFAYKEEFEKDWKVAELEEENLRLKKQLENAIVPKFKVGQKVYFIDENKIIQNFKIKKIEGLCFRYYDDIGFWVGEKDLFATKEEAEQELKRLKGE